MATFEDRMLGEKLHYYCSSSEGESEGEEEGRVEDDKFDVEQSKNAQKDRISQKAGIPEGPRTHNTGIKGVKEDARLYRRYILEQEQERFDELAKAAERFVLDEPPKSDSDLDDEDEDFMAAYRAKRMQEMKEAELPRFGTVTHLTDKSYVETVDSAHPNTHVVVYLYEENLPSCKRYKAMLTRVAQEWPKCQVCCTEASKVNMSSNFIQHGLPAFIKYKGGEVQKTWLNIREYLGEDAGYDVFAEYLQDYGILPYSDL